MSDESRRAAGILAQCKWLRDNINQWEKQAKEVLARELSGGERTKAVAADGTEIGSVTRAEGARSMQIDNEEGFLVWVKQRYPTEVVETVRPAFLKLCAEKVKVLGGLPDANGELCPHVSLVRAEPAISSKLTDEHKLLIEQMFMHRHMPEVMAAMETPEPKAIATIPVPDQPFEWERVVVGDNMYAQTQEQADALNDFIETGGLDRPAPESNDSPVDDPEPVIEEGPPNWQDSNTFETSDRIRQRRGQ